MAWFSPVKGGYPGLQQIDKTLSVGSDETGIVRGSLVYVDGSGVEPVFRLADAAQADDPTAYIYFVLVGQNDFQAGMAGTIGQGPAGGSARITALAVGQPMEFQTDQFDAEGDYAVGTLLTVGADGKLTPHTTGKNVVAQVTAVPFERWVNDAVAVAGRRTGALVEVVAASTMWIPTLTVS
jgi:hypothetical protein